MKAGRTDLDVGTLVRVTHVTDAEDADLVGAEGTLTHPFPGSMAPGVAYVAGLRLTDEYAGLYARGQVNLCAGDRFEEVEPEPGLAP